MSESALVVMDVQNYFVNKSTELVPQRVAEYLKKEKSPHVLFTKFVNTPDSNFVRWLGWDRCQRAAEIAFHPSLEPFLEEERVFTKNSFSAFNAPGFSDYLKKHQIRELRLCGLDTDSCVLATAFDAFDRGYKIEVLGELSGSHHGPSYHHEALKIIKRSMA